MNETLIIQFIFYCCENLNAVLECLNVDFKISLSYSTAVLGRFEFFTSKTYQVQHDRILGTSLNYFENKRRNIGKIQKTFFSGEAIFGGQNPKNAKKNFKNFYCPKSFVRSYRSFIYL